ncbi:ribonuclease E activity regulator RraA [Pseudomonas atacamensis]|uniref:ribonuclease E activity regulator RraA n=1 Tax=Pseudomonas atacamensis TaxID=2565368 RepID=UPI002449CF89|nr:ribonuclease E activity regulator RraA [Pseudomonas atacamensis]MDH2076863.1 ribonuclease E activity regulator RraA [Pseudomonas atacamensis]
MSVKTSDLCDQYPDDVRVLTPMFQDFGGKTEFQGRAFTLKCFEDNSRLKEVSSLPGQGRVLVVDGGASDRYALFGDVIAADLVKNGWAGVLIYGYIRDKAALRDMPIAIKALGASPRKTVKRNEGQIGVAVEFAGHTINEGDSMYGDDDGVVLLNTPL